MRTYQTLTLVAGRVEHEVVPHGTHTATCIMQCSQEHNAINTSTTCNPSSSVFLYLRFLLHVYPGVPVLVVACFDVLLGAVVFEDLNYKKTPGQKTSHKPTLLRQ